MLRNIPVSELRLGMYIDEFCDSEIENSIWKYGFFLQSEHDLLRIKNSKISSVWIDLCKGVDVAPDVLERPAGSRDISTYSDKSNTVQVDFKHEVSNAVKLCARTKTAVETMFKDLRLGRIIETEQVTTLVSEISDSIMRHPDAIISLVRLKTSDEYTYMHSVAVCALMIGLARQLELPEDMVMEAGIAGLMHDVGKSAIPTAIINKAGRLSDSEFELVRKHAEKGARMLESNPIFSPQVIDVCLHHHEKVDGSGYPHKLVGSQISLLARMGAVCDVYDAITSNRSYKEAWAPAESIRKMAEWKGHFDEQVFHAFVKCVGIYPVGSLVRLSSDRIAVVTEQNRSSLLKPRVKVFFCAKSKRKVSEIEIDLSDEACGEWIASRECALRWGFKNIENYWLGVNDA